MTPGKKQAFEPTGLIPRSIVRTFERFYKQLLPRTKYSAIREYRISRYQVLVSIRCLCTLLILPLVTRIIANWLIFPQIQYFWDVTYQDEHVFSEIDQFSQVVFFDSLLDRGSCKATEQDFTPVSSVCNDLAPNVDFYNFNNNVPMHSLDQSMHGPLKTASLPYNPTLHASLPSDPVNLLNSVNPVNLVNPVNPTDSKDSLDLKNLNNQRMVFSSSNKFSKKDLYVNGLQNAVPLVTISELKNKTIQDQALQEKIFELAQSSHFHALQSLTNVFADLLSIMVLVFLLITLRPEITILKSFLVEVIYNLSDTTKSFLLILMTDLLVGFHSPRGWETMFSLILHHFGLPENQDFVFLFVATLPVILDTVFKYWIFRHLNKISPSTVATYHNMIE